MATNTAVCDSNRRTNDVAEYADGDADDDREIKLKIISAYVYLDRVKDEKSYMSTV